MQSVTNVSKNSLPKSWAIISIVNFLIGSLLGLLMRYKIIFPFKVLSQDHTLHAHYNFMFAGWVGLALFSCIVAFVLPPEKAKRRIYSFAFYFVEFAAVGMLVSYWVLGYGTLSIFFTILNFIAALVFISQIWRDSKSEKISPGIRLFLRGAMFWYIFSFLGPLFVMNYEFIGNGTPFQLRAALYFYLHFQYNGWFTFCVFALLLHWMHTIRLPMPTKTIKIVFWLMAIGLIPGYGLSVLAFYPYIWIEIPSIFSVLTDFTAAFILLKIILKVYPHINIRTSNILKILWKIATLSFFFKIVMQAATLVPSLASFAFSYRPLIIGFLHLTFLCFVSFFLIGYFLYFGLLRINHSKITHGGLILFVVTVILSEIALFVQSFFAYIGIYLFVVNFYLFWITVVLFLGLLLFVMGQFKKRKIPQRN